MRFQDGLDAQPDVLAQSAKAVQSVLPNIKPIANGAVIALVGIGASEHAARSAAPIWRDLGLRAFAIPASELLAHTPSIADVYVALSESGRSAETVAAMTRISVRRIGVTNFADSPIVDVVDDLILLESGPDSPVYTTGFTATLQALGMLGEHWAGKSSDWSLLPGLVLEVIASTKPVIKSVLDHFDTARMIDVIGSSAANATSGEGALLLREAARAHTAAHETYNYLHGPMEPLDSQTACIVIGDGREVRLARDVSELGCHTLLVTTRSDVDSTDHLTVIQLPETPSPLALTVLQILPIQILGSMLASRRGLRVDGFRYKQDDTKLA